MSDLSSFFNPLKTDISGERKNIYLLEGSQAMPLVLLIRIE
jgi:hypothetical protein